MCGAAVRLAKPTVGAAFSGESPDRGHGPHVSDGQFLPEKTQAKGSRDGVGPRLCVQALARLANMVPTVSGLIESRLPISSCEQAVGDVR